MDHVKKSDLLLVRIAFVALLGAVTAVLRPFSLPAWVAGLCGAGGGLLTIALEVRLRRAGIKQLLGGAAGTLVGGLLGLLFVVLLMRVPSEIIERRLSSKL